MLCTNYRRGKVEGGGGGGERQKKHKGQQFQMKDCMHESITVLIINLLQKKKRMTSNYSKTEHNRFFHASDHFCEKYTVLTVQSNAALLPFTVLVHKGNQCFHLASPADFFAGADDITKEREPGIEIIEHTP